MDRRKVSKLCNLSKIENRSECEDRMERSHAEIMAQIGGKSEKEAHKILMEMAADRDVHERVTLGLLYAMLVDANNAPKHYRELSYVTRDSWTTALTNVNFLLIELFHKMKPDVKMQLLWLFREAIRSNLPKIDNVLLNLLRNVTAGLDFASNVTFAKGVVALLEDNRLVVGMEGGTFREWLKSLKPKNNVPVLAVSVLLRAIALHSHHSLAELRHKEIALCVWLVRERWTDCREMLGRDLVLALLRVAKQAELKEVWKELLGGAAPATANAPGLEQVLLTFNRQYMITFALPYRLPVQLQRKVDYLMHSVRVKQHDRHFDWIQRQFLNTVEHALFRADLIRYLCSVVPNPKAVQVSEPVQRWFIIVLLLPNTLNAYEQQQCKLCLFWDWLCFDAQTTPVTNLEPGYYVLCHLLQGKAPVANTFLEFLLRMTAELQPSMEQRTRASVAAAYRALTDAGIAQPAPTFFANTRFDPKVRSLAREVLAELWPSVVHEPTPPKHVAANQDDDDSAGKFSDDEESSSSTPAAAAAAVGESPSSDVTVVEPAPAAAAAVTTAEPAAESGRVSPSSSAFLITVDDDDEETAANGDGDADQLPEGLVEPFASHLQDLWAAADYDKRIEALQALSVTIMQQEDDEQFDAQSEIIARELCKKSFHKFLGRKRYYPKSPNNESINRILSSPIFTLFRATRSAENNEAMYTLIGDLAQESDRIGYLLLFFLKSSAHEIAANEQEAAHKVYEDFCDAVEEDLTERLIKDLDKCAEHDYRLFGYLVPFVLNTFKDESQKSPDLLHVVVRCIDFGQLLDIINEIVCENIRLFHKDSFSKFLNASLGWESMEQNFFWQLVAAEDIEWDWVLSVIPKLQHNVHSEAMCAILLLLRRSEKEPLSSLVKQLFVRDAANADDLFVVSALRTLVDINLEATAKLVAQQIEKCSSLQDPSKAQVGREKKAHKLSLEGILSHLDRFRQQCLEKRSRTVETFMRQQCMVSAFHAARHVRNRFGELFAVIEIVSSNERPGRKAKATAALKTKYLHSDDTELVYEDDMPKTRPKKRKVEVQDSDSD